MARRMRKAEKWNGGVRTHEETGVARPRKGSWGSTRREMMTPDSKVGGANNSRAGRGELGRGREFLSTAKHLNELCDRGWIIHEKGRRAAIPYGLFFGCFSKVIAQISTAYVKSRLFQLLGWGSAV
jgi:hypothetical protein